MSSHKMQLEDIFKRIKPLDEKAQTVARTRQDSLIKPIGSLGKLEELSVQLAGITSDFSVSFEKNVRGVAQSG